MDPFTQGALGAALAQSVSKDNKKELWVSFAVGWLSGMLPDLDALIRSSSDPLMFIEYHRHFTHSLVFIPLGALLPAVVVYAFLRKKFSFWRLYLFSFLGLATHGLLDSATSWGTHLLWPFTNERTEWSFISVIDPLFTLFLVVGMLLCFVKKSNAWTRIGLGFAILYLAFASYQQERATRVAKSLFERRGVSPERILVKPTIFNSILWKVLSDDGARIISDGIKIVPFREPIIYHGESTSKLDLFQEFPEVSRNTQHYKDIQRFDHFSDSWLAVAPNNQRIIGDMRFSYLPHVLSPLWGVRVSWTPSETEHVRYVTLREVSDHTKTVFFRMLLKD